MNGDVLALSGAERERLDVLRRMMRGELRQARAAELAMLLRLKDLRQGTMAG